MKGEEFPAQLWPSGVGGFNVTRGCSRYLAMFAFLGSSCSKAPLKSASHKANLLFPGHCATPFSVSQFFQMCCISTNLLERGWLQARQRSSWKCLGTPKPTQNAGSGTKNTAWLWALHLDYHTHLLPLLRAAPRHQKLL